MSQTTSNDFPAHVVFTSHVKRYNRGIIDSKTVNIDTTVKYNAIYIGAKYSVLHILNKYVVRLSKSSHDRALHTSF